MRINLVTPFAEKDAAKSLGARWDPNRKVWYIIDPRDLSPFMRWIPDLAAATETPSAAAPRPDTEKTAGPASSAAAIVTGPKSEIANCGCDAPPWEDCRC